MNKTKPFISKSSISEIISDVNEYSSSPDLKFACPDETKFQVVDNIKKYLT